MLLATSFRSNAMYREPQSLTFALGMMAPVVSVTVPTIGAVHGLCAGCVRLNSAKHPIAAMPAK